MRFLKEDCDGNGVVYEPLNLNMAYSILVFKLTFCFYELEIAIGIEREMLFIVIVICRNSCLYHCSEQARRGLALPC